jgi:hypothetical protein
MNLKGINGFRATQEATQVTQMIEFRAEGGAQFTQALAPAKPSASAPKI